MSTLDTIFLSGAVCAFVIFAVALAWAEYRTRHIGRPRPEAGSAAGFELLKSAAAKSDATIRSSPAAASNPVPH